MREPRGHADMCGALLTEPAAPGSHAGVIFMNAFGYPALSGHGIIALATIALERGLLMPGGDGLSIVFDTVAGTVRARAAGTPERVDRVTVTGVPSFVAQGSLTVKTAGRLVRADVAFGGGFYAIVDSEAVGLSVDVARIPELRRAGREIAEAVDAVQAWVHPGTGAEEDCAGDDFHGAAAGRGHRSSIRDRARRWPGRPVARRNGHRGNHGRPRRDGFAGRGSAVRPRGDSSTRG